MSCKHRDPIVVVVRSSLKWEEGGGKYGWELSVRVLSLSEDVLHCFFPPFVDPTDCVHRAHLHLMDCDDGWSGSLPRRVEP